MRYFDTSFLVPLILPESTSDRVAAFVGGLPSGDLAVSQWTRVELSSLLARKVRIGDLGPDDAARADATFERMVQAAFVVLLPSADDFTRAKAFLAACRDGLRAGDALHLAVARSHHAEAVHSLDKVMIKAGKELGLRVDSGIRLPGYDL